MHRAVWLCLHCWRRRRPQPAAPTASRPWFGGPASARAPAAAGKGGAAKVGDGAPEPAKGEARGGASERAAATGRGKGAAGSVRPQGAPGRRTSRRGGPRLVRGSREAAQKGRTAIVPRAEREDGRRDEGAVGGGSAAGARRRRFSQFRRAVRDGVRGAGRNVWRRGQQHGVYQRRRERQRQRSRRPPRGGAESGVGVARSCADQVAGGRGDPPLRKRRYRCGSNCCYGTCRFRTCRFRTCRLSICRAHVGRFHGCYIRICRFGTCCGREGRCSSCAARGGRPREFAKRAGHEPARCGRRLERNRSHYGILR